MTSEELLALARSAASTWHVRDPATSHEDLVSIAVVGILQGRAKDESLAVYHGRCRIRDFWKSNQVRRRSGQRRLGPVDPRGREWRPDEYALESDLRLAILECDGLRDDHRRVIELTAEGWTSREIAGELGMTKHAVDRRRRVALAVIREQLKTAIEQE